MRSSKFSNTFWGFFVVGLIYNVLSIILIFVSTHFHGTFSALSYAIGIAMQFPNSLFGLIIFYYKLDWIINILGIIGIIRFNLEKM